VAVSLVLVATAALLYLGARETPVFAVRTIDVDGARPSVARRVEMALHPLEGKSLLKVRSGEVERLATALPSIASVTYDRAFPNTLRVRVEEEQPVAVVRQGIDAWLVSRRGRVIKRIAQRTHRVLPRIWLRQPLRFRRWTLSAAAGADEVAMLDALEGARLARRVGSVRNESGQWIYVLRGGLQVRVGTRSELALKLAIARRILERRPSSATWT
jgi:hypothetical protein